MKEITSKIAYIDSYAVDTVSKHVVLSEYTYPDIRSKIRGRILSFLLNIRSGVVFSFSFTHDLLSDRVQLEDLRKKGYIDSYGEGVVYCDYPRFNFFGIVLFIEQQKSTIRSWGYSFPFDQKNIAIKKAVWEGIERQSSYYLKKDATILRTRFHKGDATFLYESLPKFTTIQIRDNLLLLAHKEQLQSIEGFKVSPITVGPSRFLPASCFYWGEIISNTDCIFQESNTSGSGGGYTKETATLSALYELIERDLFLLFWYSKVKPRIIDIDAKEGVFFDYVRDARTRFNLEIYFFDTTYDIDVPSCTCLVVDPVLNLSALGAKVSSDAETSMRGGLLEALATLSTVRSRKNNIQEDELRDYIQKKKWGDYSIDKTKRVNLYCSSYGIELIKDLWIGDGTKRITFDDFNIHSQKFTSAKNELTSLVDKFKKLITEKGEGYHIYTHQFHSAWATMSKYIIVHGFVPSFLKLHLNEEYSAPLSKRLSEFALAHGAVINDENDINSLPHFFP